MANSGRIVLAGYPHHVLRQASAGRRAFNTASDFHYAIEEIRQLSATYAIDIHAFCLLPDRIHLLLTPVHTGSCISTFMKAFSSRISLRNRRTSGESSPWVPRFNASLVEPGHWAMACMAYIEHLPVDVGATRSASLYQFSSYRVRAGKTPRYWLVDLPEYLRLGTGIDERLGVYKHYLRRGLDAKEEMIISRALGKNYITASSRFMEKVGEKLGRQVEQRGPGRPPKRHNP